MLPGTLAGGEGVIRKCFKRTREHFQTESLLNDFHSIDNLLKLEGHLILELTRLLFSLKSIEAFSFNIFGVSYILKEFKKSCVVQILKRILSEN